MNWLKLVTIALLLAYLGFERWLAKAYTKPLLTMEFDDVKLSAPSTLEMELLLDMLPLEPRTANEEDGAQNASPEAIHERVPNTLDGNL